MSQVLNSNTKHFPLVLIILDGWGHREDPQHNAIASANIPFWRSLWDHCPHTLIDASAHSVGLPPEQMGNSEVGHLHIGAGRLVTQDLTRIDLDIESGKFYKNSMLASTVDQLVKNNRSLHILGLLSPGGVHSHESHIQAMIKLAAERGLHSIYFHAFLDGRDTPPKSAEASLVAIEQLFRTLKCGQIASLIGRYYAMDRDKRWERIQCAYDLLTMGKSVFQAPSPLDGLKQAYQRGEIDEFVQATSIHSPTGSPITLQSGDAVVFMNFRSDRARQLTYSLTDAKFEGFIRDTLPSLSTFITLTEYAANIKAQVAYPPLPLKNTIGEYISKLGYKQLRIAETEKYAHVTFFLNGGEEHLYPGEDRILIPSPSVATYDLQPEMSADALTDALVKAIESRKYALIVCNFANPDMVGHSGNFKATVKAIETIDRSLKRIVQALKNTGGEALITADHGNAECMFDTSTNQPHTAHTTNRVPALYVGRPAKATTSEGALYDIAPTLLYLMGLESPKEMTGKSLFKID